MSPELAECERQALQLTLADRAALAEHLIASLDAGEDTGAEKLWIKEAETRYASYERGEITSSPADEVLERTRKNLK